MREIWELVGGMTEVVTNGYNGIVLENPKEEIAYTINQIFKNRETFENIADNGRDTIKRKYSWELSRKSISKVYETLQH